MHLEASLPANETETYSRRSAYGRKVRFNELLFIVSRPGYRPVLTRRLLVAAATIYFVLVLVVLLRAASVTLWRSLPDHHLAAGGHGHGVEDGRRTESRSGVIFHLLWKRWQRHLRRSRTSGRRWRPGAPPATGGLTAAAGFTAADDAVSANRGGGVGGGATLETTLGH